MTNWRRTPRALWLMVGLSFASPALAGSRKVVRTLEQAAEQVRRGQPQEALTTLAHLDLATSTQPRAVEHRNRILQRDFLVIRGLARLELGDRRGGRSDHEAALALGSCDGLVGTLLDLPEVADAHPETWLTKVECLFDTQRSDEARLLLGQALDRHPDDRELQQRRLRLVEPGGPRDDTAFAVASRFVVHPEVDAEAIATVAEGLQAPDVMIHLVERGHARFPESPRLGTLLAELRGTTPPRLVERYEVPVPPDLAVSGGHVRCHVLVDEAGRVTEVRIFESQPAGVFDDTAKLALRRWRFRPAIQAGKPVSAWIEQRIAFGL